MTLLNSAFWFACDECGHTNFLKASEGEIRDETGELAEEFIESVHFETADEMNEESPYLVFRVSIAPSFVKCMCCGKMQAAQIPEVEA